MRRLPTAAGIGLLVAFSGLVAATAHAQEWEELAPFPDPSEELLGAVADGKLFVFAGLAPCCQPKGLVYAYDPADDTWARKGDMPLASHHLGITELKGKIYLLGGFKYPDDGKAGWQPIDNAWEYDPANDSWKALAPMPSKRGSPVAAVADGKIYVIGGATTSLGSNDTAIGADRPQRSVGTNEVYNPESDSWETVSPMPTARNHAAVGVVDGKIYVIGGRLGSAFIMRASNTDIVEVYDPATDQWGALRAPMPTARSAMAAGTYDGKIYVAGGEVQTSSMLGAFRAFEAYDPATDSWSVLPPMPFPRHGHAGGIVDGRFHVVSGDVQSARSGADVDVEYHHAIDLRGE
jgi:N-acetylneuraminic acid mutarotase